MKKKQTKNKHKTRNRSTPMESTSVGSDEDDLSFFGSCGGVDRRGVGVVRADGQHDQSDVLAARQFGGGGGGGADAADALLVPRRPSRGSGLAARRHLAGNGTHHRRHDLETAADQSLAPRRYVLLGRHPTCITPTRWSRVGPTPGRTNLVRKVLESSIRWGRDPTHMCCDPWVVTRTGLLTFLSLPRMCCDLWGRDPWGRYPHVL